MAKPLPEGACNLVYRCCVNVDMTYEGIRERNLDKIYQAFANQPLCNTLSMKESKELFKKMCLNTREYLDDYFELDEYFDM